MAARWSRRTRKVRAKAHQWMDWQLSVIGPAITPVFWGLIRTPPEKRDANAIDGRQGKDDRRGEDHGRAARQDALHGGR